MSHLPFVEGQVPGPVIASSAPPAGAQSFIPADWTHMDTIALEAAHELISEVTGTFSAEAFELLKDPIRNKVRLDAIQAIDIQAAEDGLRLASFDRKTIASITRFYADWLAKIKAEEAQSA